jgi:hypothetical protein
MDIASEFITPGIVFLLTVASGLWLGNTGKPLNTIIFTVHKLIALATVILMGIAIYPMINYSQTQSLIIALVIVGALCVLALFATGALLSRDKPVNNNLLNIHRVAPVLVVILMAVIIYYSAGRGR